jgi:8-oxo-dGTP diphosphatase
LRPSIAGERRGIPEITMQPPQFYLTADVLAVRRTSGSLEVLLILRKYPPFQGKWALPGGFVEKDEDVRTAAFRELEEETGLRPRTLIEFGSFSDPQRDPRGRVVTIAYFTLVDASDAEARPGDDAGQVQWFPIEELPEMAADHAQIVRQGIEALNKAASVP